MKAIRASEFGGPDVLNLEDVPDLTPGAGEVVVRVHAAGVNPVDTYILAGTYAFQPPLPYTPGMDGAGEVIAVGEGVTRAAVGDRVYLAGSVSGTYAEQALCTEAQVYPLPDKASFTQGAALGIPYATAYRALFERGEAKANETILVHGASGAAGLATLQLARAAGMTIIGTAGSDAGLNLIREHGAHHALNHHDEAHFAEITKLTKGRGVDVVIEMLANVNLGRDLGVLAKHGRVVVVGNRGTVEINPRDLMGRDADIRGMTLMNVDGPGRDRIHAALRAGLDAGYLNPVVSRELPLADAATAQRDVIGSSTFGKIVLVP